MGSSPDTGGAGSRGRPRRAGQEVAGPPLPPRGWPGARLPGTGTALEPSQPPSQAHERERAASVGGAPLPPQTLGASGQPPMPEGPGVVPDPESQPSAATARRSAHNPPAARWLLRPSGRPRSWGQGTGVAAWQLLPGPQQPCVEDETLSSLCKAPHLLPPSPPAFFFLSLSPPPGSPPGLGGLHCADLLQEQCHSLHGLFVIFPQGTKPQKNTKTCTCPQAWAGRAGFLRTVRMERMAAGALDDPWLPPDHPHCASLLPRNL